MANYNDPAGAAGAQLGYWIASLFNKDKAKTHKDNVNKPTQQVVQEGLDDERRFKEYEDLLFEATIKNDGKPLSNSDLKELIPDWVGSYEYAYAEWYKANKDEFSGDKLVQHQTQLTLTEAQQSTATVYAFEKLMEQLGYTPKDIKLQQLELGELNEQGLLTDYQTILDAENAAVSQQYAAQMEELTRAENDMYRAIGLSQRQMERDIAKRRQQALKSGMSTAQLAAQEQQNILAAQAGATQIAQQYANDRYGVINQFAGATAQNYANVLAQQQQYTNQINEYNNQLLNQQAQFNAQQQTNWANALATVYGQNYASDAYAKQLENTK